MILYFVQTDLFHSSSDLFCLIPVKIIRAKVYLDSIRDSPSLIHFRIQSKVTFLENPKNRYEKLLSVIRSYEKYVKLKSRGKMKKGQKKGFEGARPK